MRLVLIDWVDSYGCSSSWEWLEECDPEVMICRSVDWLLHDGDTCKTVVSHVIDKPSQGCGDMTIPVQAILRMIDLMIPD